MIINYYLYYCNKDQLLQKVNNNILLELQIYKTNLKTIDTKTMEIIMSCTNHMYFLKTYFGVIQYILTCLY